MSQNKRQQAVMEEHVPFRSEALDHRYGQHRHNIEPLRLTRGVVLAACATVACLVLLLVWLNTWEFSFAGRQPQTLMSWLMRQLSGAAGS